MAINARGDQFALLARRQADFATVEAAAAGKFYKLPFYDFAQTPSEELSEDDAIVGDAFPGDAVPGLRSMAGDITVPLGLQSIGWHLAALLGDPVTTDDTGGNYTHVFSAAALPTLLHNTFGLSHKGIDEHFSQRAATYNTLRLTAQKTGERARLTFGLLGAAEEKLVSSLDATPVSFVDDITPINHQAGIYRDGGLMAGITQAEMTLSAGLAPDQEEIDTTPDTSGILEGRWSFSGSLTARFRDTVLYDLGEAGTAFDLEKRYVIDATQSIVFRAHNLRLERTGIPVQGRDIITSSFNFKANRPADGDTPFRVTLKNQVASYDNLV